MTHIFSLPLTIKRSLWTSFLPTRIDRVRFNLGACAQDGKDGTEDMLQVDAHLTDSTPAKMNSKPCLTVDISISNDCGQTEIQIEGLTVTSISKTRPEDDHELYLHTVMEIDPTDEIVQFGEDTAFPLDPMLVESCEQVAAFYTESSNYRVSHLARFRPLSLLAPPGVPGCNTASGNEEEIESLVRNSPHQSSLAFIQSVGRVLPDLLPSILPLAVEEASQLHRYNHHVHRVVKQIVHRYPRMNVLTMVGPVSGLQDHILSGLGSSFLSCTVGGIGQDNKQNLSVGERLSQLVCETTIDLRQDIKQQLSLSISNDLVVVTDSFLQAGRERAILNNIRASMSPGGFLVLLRISQSPLKRRLNQITGAIPHTAELVDHSTWLDILDECGYQKAARNSDQEDIPGFSISVRRNNILSLEPLRTPWTQLELPPLTDKLLIVGSGTSEVEPLSVRLKNRLLPFCGTISVQKSVESLSLTDSSDYTSAIILADLDKPILSNLTDSSLQQLKDLIRPNMTILWLTLNAQSGNPEHAATLGFTRTVAAEIPNLNLQVLDLEQIKQADDLITDTFVRLVYPNPPPAENLWTREPEIYLENGRRLIARVLPLKESNDRLNAQRRVVSKGVNTASSCVEIVSTGRTEDPQSYEARQSDGSCMYSPQAGYTTLQVTCSSTEMVQVGTNQYVHVCIGRDMATGMITAALSPTNASYNCVPTSQTQVLTKAISSTYQLARCLIHYLTAAAIYEQASGRQIVLINADGSFLECVREVGAGKERRITSWVTTSKEACHDTSSVYLHPRSSDRHIRSIIPSKDALIYDFSENGEISDRIVALLPSGCDYQPRSSILKSHHSNSAAIPGAELSSDSKLSAMVAMALRRSQSQTVQRIGQPDVVSVNQLVSGSGSSFPPFSIVDWIMARDTTEMVKPLVQENLFSPSKTYILVGLTRDLGQSLTRLFVEHGARHVVLASRNPQMSPNWIKEFSMACGAQLIIEKMDVSKLDSVKAFKARISESMPPVGGVINGAMVLDDRVFSQMTLESWYRVLVPKTVGSKNLDIVFSQPDLEFFIMTSSFAAIGGHPGQSNYATANMYMNGLAVNRRNRGLAASVLNIGVIYGLGLLQREKEELYAGLEREGYPPISERDIHHMFLEAIVAGRPGQPDKAFEITTGLSRFRWGSENPLHWHLDPRFSHFTVNDDSSIESSSQARTQISLLDELTSLGDLEAMTERLVAAFTERLQSLMQLVEGNISRHSSLTELGIDSLIAVDIRNWFWKKLGKDVAVLKLLGSSSIYQRKCSPAFSHAA
jgi:NAD(P)-dependent dehydrogenase (short-subunit alcohol dehydrogenase family)